MTTAITPESTDETARPPRDVWLVVLSGLLWLAVSAMIFSSRYLPMVDLPQHAAQLSSWVHLDDPAYGFAQQFEVNWKTPYLLGYLLARCFVPFLGVNGALKAVVAVAALLSLFSWRTLLLRVGQDAWLSLLGVPLTFGFAFHFGFINYLLATSLVIFSVACALSYGRTLSFRHGAQLTACLWLTFLNHGLAFVVAAASSLLVVYGGGRSRSALFRAHIPFFLAAAIVLPWLPGFISGSGKGQPLKERWFLSMDRIWDFPGYLFSASGQDKEAFWGGLLLLSMLILAIGKWGGPRPWWTRCGLLLVALLGYCFFPFEVRGVAYLFERFAVFIPVGVILLGGESRPLLAARIRRPMVVTFAAAWTLLFGLRLIGFHEDVDGYDRVVSGVGPKPSVRPLIVNMESAAYPGLPVFLHFPAYLHADRGGFYGFSFGRFYTNFMRFKPHADQGMRNGMEWMPFAFNARLEAPKYDVFVARAPVNMGPYFFRSARCKVRVEAAANTWWRYSCVPRKLSPARGDAQSPSPGHADSSQVNKSPQGP